MRREFKIEGGYYASFSLDGTLFAGPNGKGDARNIEAATYKPLPVGGRSITPSRLAFKQA